MTFVSGRPLIFSAGLLNVPSSSPRTFFARSISIFISLPGTWIVPTQWPEGLAALCARWEATAERHNAATSGVRNRRCMVVSFVMRIRNRGAPR